MNLLSAFCRKQMIWNLRRRSGSGLPPGIRRFSGGAKTDKVGQALCLPFVLADFVSLALPHAAELAHFVARPLPSETAALCFAGGPGQDEESVSPAPVASARTIYC